MRTSSRKNTWLWLRLDTESSAESSAGCVMPRDTDGDGIPDFKDVDSDNDGEPDNTDTDILQPFCGPGGGSFDGMHAEPPDYYKELHGDEEAQNRWNNGADELCHGTNVCITRDNYEVLNKTEDYFGNCSRPDMHTIPCDKDDTNKIRGGCPWPYACNDNNRCVPYGIDHKDIAEVNSVILDCKNISESDIQNINGLTDFSGDDNELCSQYTNNVFTRCHENKCREPSSDDLDNKVCSEDKNETESLKISDDSDSEPINIKNEDCMVNSIYSPPGPENNTLIPSPFPVCEDGTCREYNQREREILQAHNEYSSRDSRREVREQREQRESRREIPSDEDRTDNSFDIRKTKCISSGRIWHDEICPETNDLIEGVEGHHGYCETDISGNSNMIAKGACKSPNTWDDNENTCKDSDGNIVHPTPSPRDSSITTSIEDENKSIKEYKEYYEKGKDILEVGAVGVGAYALARAGADTVADNEKFKRILKDDSSQREIERKKRSELRDKFTNKKLTVQESKKGEIIKKMKKNDKMLKRKKGGRKKKKNNKKINHKF